MMEEESLFASNTLTINMFKIKPSSDTIEVGYIELSDDFQINQYIHKLETKHECIAGPQYGNYRNLDSGVYFVCGSLDELNDNIEYRVKQIDSCSYVMKYILIKAIARRIEKLGRSGAVFLPQKWFAYSQITCCDEVLRSSEPHRFFVLRPCLTLRVEHIPVDNKDALFLVADLKFRRFHSLTLSKIVNLLAKKGYDRPQILGMLREHYYSCIDAENRYDCIIENIHGDTASIMINYAVRTFPTDNILLNPHPKHTRIFIEHVLGENLGEIDRIQRTLGRQRPKRKIGDIMGSIEKLLIQNNVFPLKLGNIEYDLKPTPMRIVLG